MVSAFAEKNASPVVRRSMVREPRMQFWHAALWQRRSALNHLSPLHHLPGMQHFTLYRYHI